MSRCILIVTAALLLRVGHAEEAIVETRDGHTYEGVISLRDGSLSVINAEHSIWVTVPSTNLLSALFKPRSPDPYLPRVYAAQAENDEELWSNQDIGWASAPGNGTFFAGLRRTFCTGTNITGASDSCHFTYQPLRGNREIVARIIRIPRGQSAKAGLMFRDSLKPNAPNIFLGLSAGGGGMFQYRQDAGGDTLEFQRPDLFVPQWLKLKREGNRISAFKSGNGRRWTHIQDIELPLGDEFFAGLAVAGINSNPFERQFAMYDNLAAGSSLPLNPYRPVVRLQSGSTISGRIYGATDSQVDFMGPLARAPLALTAISRMDFQWVPYRFSSFLNEARPGVLLANGDFIEGEFKGLEDNHVLVSSVLIGVRTYDVNQDVLSIILRPPSQKPYAFEVSTIDGSRWLASDLQFARDELVVRDTSLGACHLPIYELAEIRRFPFHRSTASLAQNTLP